LESIPGCHWDSPIFKLALKQFALEQVAFEQFALEQVTLVPATDIGIDRSSSAIEDNPSEDSGGA
jgi:hypothetical protein